MRRLIILMTVLCVGLLSVSAVASAQVPELPELPDRTPTTVCFSITATDDETGETVTVNREFVTAAFAASVLVARSEYFSIGPCADEEAGVLPLAGLTDHCINPAGNEPQGQCKGQPLETETRNPAGKAPPGHNKVTA